MFPSLRAAVVLLLWAAVCSPAPLTSQAEPVPSVRRVRVLDSRNQVEIEIETSDRVVPQINVLTGPDRLVVDFVNALPGPQLRNQPVNRGEVKSLRVGLFSSDPPVTRVVLDLNGPQRYQVFPSARSVILKVGGTAGTEAARFTGAPGAALMNANYAVQATPPSAPAPPPVKPPLEVSFQGGLLSISSNKASLSEILSAVHQRTGAEIAIPAGADQEKVMAEIGPAPAPEVLAHLLNGTQFNFLILSSPTNPGGLDRVILTPRPQGSMPTPLPQAQSLTSDEEGGEVQPQAAPPTRIMPPIPNPNPANDGPGNNDPPN
ncbi:MAG: AMIN domain-containing protein [Candidatus Sulfotelmatobacter sp.]